VGCTLLHQSSKRIPHLSAPALATFREVVESGYFRKTIKLLWKNRSRCGSGCPETVVRRGESQSNQGPLPQLLWDFFCKCYVSDAGEVILQDTLAVNMDIFCSRQNPLEFNRLPYVLIAK